MGRARVTGKLAGQVGVRTGFRNKWALQCLWRGICINQALLAICIWNMTSRGNTKYRTMNTVLIRNHQGRITNNKTFTAKTAQG